jgi:hypothetical protein
VRICLQLSSAVSESRQIRFLGEGEWFGAYRSENRLLSFIEAMRGVEPTAQCAL